MPRLAAFLLALAVLAGAWLVGSPHLAARQLSAALRAGDSVALERRVDFPVLRQNLKEQLNAKMLEKAGGDAVENPIGAVVMGIASIFVEAMVDAFVTPSGLSSLASGRIPPAPGEPGPDADAPERDPFERARITRDALDRFSMWVPDDSGREIRFVLSLQGVSWRLTNILLPPGGRD
jgi:hypothetical protein